MGFHLQINNKKMYYRFIEAPRKIECKNVYVTSNYKFSHQLFPALLTRDFQVQASENKKYPVGHKLRYAVQGLRNPRMKKLGNIDKFQPSRTIKWRKIKLSDA